MKFVYTISAYKDIQRLKDFIAIKNPVAASRVVDELISGVDYLMQFPDMGIEVQSSPNPDAVRDVYILDYHVRYLKLKYNIHIVRIWHQKED